MRLPGLRQSIFLRMLMLALGMILIAVLVLNLFLYGFFHDYIYRGHEQMLLNAAQRAEEQTRRLAGRELSPGNWEKSLLLIDRSTGVHLAVLQGRRLVAGTDSQIYYILHDQVLLDRVLAFRPTERRRSLQTESGPETSLMAVAVPLNSYPGGATLVAYLEVSNVNGVLKDSLQMVWLASIMALLLAIPLVYLISRNFTRPLKEMQVVASRLAEGHLSERFAVDSGDELGTLSRVLNQMTARLEQLENQRQEFLANVSHDLRTPLTSISGFIQGILDGTIPEQDHQRYLSLAYQETQRLAEIANDLLDMARMRAGQLEFRWEPLDLREIGRETVETLQPLAADRGIDLRLSLPVEVLAVRGDRNRLMQVLINILDNALKFTPPGGRVVVKGEMLDSVCRLAVSDNGPGIPEEDLPFIFERFYRGTQGGGTGLGLAICKLIIDAHRGAITVKSAPGQETAFIIDLPRCP